MKKLIAKHRFAILCVMLIAAWAMIYFSAQFHNWSYAMTVNNGSILYRICALALYGIFFGGVPLIDHFISIAETDIRYALAKIIAVVVIAISCWRTVLAVNTAMLYFIALFLLWFSAIMTYIKYRRAKDHNT